MKPLNLDRLNTRAPYSVWSVGEGVFGFKTDHNVMLRIYLDKNIRETIFYIIEEFFDSNPDILLYQCETGDSKQAARDRLFVRWFKEYAGNEKYCIRVAKIVAENVEHYTAIILQQTNPELEKIVNDFDNFMGFLQNKPT